MNNAEICKTVDWMLTFYTREGETLSKLEKAAMQRDVMALIDIDKDSKLNLAEFLVIYNQVEEKKSEARRMREQSFKM